MQKNIVIIHPKDNVGVALREIKAGEIIIGAEGKSLAAKSDIPPSHKVALDAIPEGGAVIKYGEPVGNAKGAIQPGEWVHTHNVA